MQKKLSSFAEGPHQGGGRKEDSGLIDLDALMRQAAESERDVARAAAGPAAASPVNVPVPEVKPAATPGAAKATERAPRAATLAPPVMTPAPGTVRSPSVAKTPAATGATKPIVREPDESLAGVSTATAAAAAVVTARADAAPTSGAAPGATNELDRARASSGKPARSSRRGYAVGAAVAVLLCASVVGYRASRPDAAQAMKPSTSARVDTAANAAPPVPSDPRPATATPGAPEIGASDLPSAPSPADERVAARNVPAGRAAAGAARARDEHAAPPADPKVTALVLPDSPARDPSDLGAAMRGAVGAKTQIDPATVAGPASSARTLRPSPGAVVGAINGVLPGARACLGEDDPVTVASITFKNDGAVSRVDISGDRPTNGCVRTSLSKARIEPFADDTFVTRVTVRP
jgi:hypothetical protein